MNDFLPTNSQVLVITAYWFREETEVVKKVAYEVSISRMEKASKEETASKGEEGAV